MSGVPVSTSIELTASGKSVRVPSRLETTPPTKTLVTLAFAFFASTALADGSHSGDHGDAGMSIGKFTKIGTQWNRLTIDHGPLDYLDMRLARGDIEARDYAARKERLTS